MNIAFPWCHLLYEKHNLETAKEINGPFFIMTQSWYGSNVDKIKYIDLFDLIVNGSCYL